MNFVIAGSRGFNNYELLKRKCDHLLQNIDSVTIISGTASGADKLGERYAKERGYQVMQMPADWDKYGKSAGYKRNTQMADIADGVIIFWDGKSPGTKHMIDIATERKLPVRIIRY